MSQILSIGFDKALSQVRNAALAGAGYAVDAARSGEEAQAFIIANWYDAVVIGEAVPDGTRAQLAQRIKRANPRIIVVMMYQAAIAHTELADAVLSSGDPTHLLDALSMLLRDREQRQRKVAR